MIFYLINKYNTFTHKLSILILNQITSFLFNTNFLLNFLNINDIIWQEGLLIDFLQKKIIDNWIKKFIIFSTNLMNDRLIYDKLIKFFLFLIINPFHKYNFLDVNNITNFFFFILLFFFFTFIFIFVILTFL